MRSIWLATTNPAKIDRLTRILDGLPLRIRRLNEAPPVESPVEDGHTYLENATIKARAYSQSLPGLVIATDGGAEIPILGDRWRGIHTGRIAGAVDDRAKLEYVLRLLAPHRGEDRRAYWNEAVALAEAGEIQATWTVRGRAGYLAATYDPDRIERGFWLATLWIDPEIGRPYADLTPAERERVVEHWIELAAQVRAYFGAG